ncbi:MAG TPA: hypothetical protein VK211_12790 [Kamptonema sp.]|nr:hypothetical protein [Kamptonema sp.]
MTTEQWDDNRLDRLANMVESNARVIQALANVAAEAREEREQLFQRMEQQNAIIVQQQEEIVGLRIEIRRTLDILLNQRDRGDNPTA